MEGPVTTATRLKISAWRFVLTFGTVSLLADFVYEGARSVTGPLLAELGATALVVGIVTGIGEAAALLLRLVSGPLADRTKRFWAWTLAGYALTVISVPTLGFSGVLWVACTLVILERIGKAVRSPAKDALLSFATASTGRGRGFAAHEAMDQIGAIIGPLVVARNARPHGERLRTLARGVGPPRGGSTRSPGLAPLTSTPTHGLRKRRHRGHRNFTRKHDRHCAPASHVLVVLRIHRHHDAGICDLRRAVLPYR